MTAFTKLFRTTTFRLSLSYLALFSAAAAVAIFFIYWNTTVLLSRQLNQTIEAELTGLAEQYRAGGLDQLVRIVAERSETPGNSLYLVADKDGKQLAGNLSAVSPQLWDSVGPVEFVYSRPASGGVERRLAFANVFRLPGGYRLIVGRDIEDRRELSRLILNTMLWGLGAMALVGIGGGYWFSRKLLTRIDGLAATTRTIMAGDLAGRLPVSGSGDELDRLSQSVNLMLARIEQLMAGLREVSDNIAHDLKTPLNRLRNRVEEALREPQDETAYRDVLERTIEEADGLIKTFNALLSIARLEAGAGGENRDTLDMAALVQDVAELYEPVAEERGIALKAQAADPIIIHGDRQLLGQALANLIDNALKYGAPSAGAGNGYAPEVDVQADARGGVARIVVSDRGPGVPDTERVRVLSRFVRLEESRSEPGSGLGLSLVAAVARLHGGKLRLEDNEPGLRVVLSLPMEGDALTNGAAVESSTEKS
ncbi:MAG: HAMP domain-containing sensor histidine kinase [Hyphomicrobiaceae bacterium]|nr:HAMP domain-containing sensor histidine kinase [Hyphomicrobiaceae bacterium]MDX2448818.1 HAMP domain-containing sensor histidine kinase [Hyphomicrobiaceae bacterium]